MKTLYVYRISNPSFFQNVLLQAYRLSNFRILTWGSALNRTTSIDFPRAGLCTQFENESRKILKSYFENESRYFHTNIFNLDYIRKSLDISFLDYHVFHKTVLGFKSDDRSLFFKKSMHYYIEKNARPPIKLTNIFTYLVTNIRIHLDFLKSLIAIIMTHKKEQSGPILYLRKKVYPDMGEFSRIAEAINEKDNENITGFYPLFSFRSDEHGFKFLNAIKGIFIALIKAFISFQKESIFDLYYFTTRGIDSDIFKNYLKDNYKAKIVTNLKPKAICGILVDKPFYNLIYKNKSPDCKILSLNESFFFPPSRSFDYNHLDVYFSMNQIDKEMQNQNGGIIHSFHQVEFFRHIQTRSKSISNELLSNGKKFKNKVAFLTAQMFVEKSGYYYWDKRDLTEFVEESLRLSKFFPDTLFIFKEKKGEFSLLEDQLLTELNNTKNIFIIPCKKPRELQLNRFEDLLDYCDLTVSMCHTSTTIWQSFASGKPAIAVNNTHPISVLAKFPSVESNLEDLAQNIQFWLSLDSPQKNKYLNDIRNEFNIGKSEGILQISKYLQDQFL